MSTYEKKIQLSVQRPPSDPPWAPQGPLADVETSFFGFLRKNSFNFSI